MQRSNGVKKVNYNNANYNNTSEAHYYAPYYDDYYNYENTKRIKRRVVKKRKSKTVYSKVAEEVPVHLFKMVFTICMVFVFSIAILYSHAINTNQRNNLLVLNAQLKEITQDNVYLKTELTKNLNLDEVENLATIKLGMQKPSSYQTVYIDVPLQGSTMQYEDVTNKTNKLDWKSVKNFLFRK